MKILLSEGERVDRCPLSVKPPTVPSPGIGRNLDLTLGDSRTGAEILRWLGMAGLPTEGQIHVS